MAIEISTRSEPNGLCLFDSNEQRQLPVRTPEPVSIEPGDADRFCFPVDTTCSIETETLVFDQKYLVNIHDATGRAAVRLKAGDTYPLGPEPMFIGMDGPMKLYCRVEDSGSISISMNAIRITFDRPATVEFGARSLHERPVGTITTPEDPHSMLSAVSALSSALKTETPERSWPTLRGHPPLIEFGEEFSVSTPNEPPETDISIEVPPTYENIFTVSPLAFYLGADVKEGATPRLVTADTAYEFGATRPLEDDIARTLKRVFLFDCLVRTEGVYQYELHEREGLKGVLPCGLDDLYNQPLSAQLERYLQVPYEQLEPYIPQWPLTAYVPSEPSSVELLPFIVNELGIVRAPRGTETILQTSTDVATARSASGPTVTDGHAAFARSASPTRDSTPTSHQGDDEISVVEPEITDDSLEHAWFADSIPRGASKATLDGYRNQLDRHSRTQSIEILVVCNDARMLDEHDLLDETYGTREVLPFDVTSKFGVSTDDLAALLETGGYDFLHYIGHATADGLRCPDGELDVRSLSSVDLGVFFLNACQSYEQGVALAENGAFGGVATLGDIINSHAVESGAALARLLNLGFPLRGALKVVTEQTLLGDQYLIVGDGSVDIAQTDGGAPSVVTLDALDENTYTVNFDLYPAKDFRIGSVTSPNVDPIEQVFLLPMHNIETQVEEAELREFLSWTEMPIILDGSLQWNTDIGPPSFASSL